MGAPRLGALEVTTHYHPPEIGRDRLRRAPKRPVIADWGLIAPPRPGTCEFAIWGSSPIYRR
eukprot:8148236-Pyramimonas_sp.AAC.1